MIARGRRGCDRETEPVIVGRNRFGSPQRDCKHGIDCRSRFALPLGKNKQYAEERKDRLALATVPREEYSNQGLPLGLSKTDRQLRTQHRFLFHADVGNKMHDRRTQGSYATSFVPAMYILASQSRSARGLLKVNTGHFRVVTSCLVISGQTRHFFYSISGKDPTTAPYNTHNGRHSRRVTSTATSASAPRKAQCQNLRDSRRQAGQNLRIERTCGSTSSSPRDR